jgi:hypothetical protein
MPRRNLEARLRKLERRLPQPTRMRKAPLPEWLLNGPLKDVCSIDSASGRLVFKESPERFKEEPVTI